MDKLSSLEFPPWMLRHRWLVASVCLVVVQTIFGGYSVITSAAFKSSGMNPLAYAMCRDTLGALTLMTALLVVEYRKPISQQRLFMDYGDVGYFVLLALLGVWGSQGLSAMALNELSAVVFAAAEPSQPVVALIACFLLGYERFRLREWTTWGKIVGVFIAAGSAVALVLFSASERSAARNSSSSVPLGAAILLVQIVTGGLYPVAQKSILRRYSSLFVAAWTYAIGCILLLMSVITGATDSSDWQSSKITIGAIFYSGLLASGLNYGTISFAVKISSPLLVSAFMPVQAILAAFFSWWFLGTEIKLSHFLGGGGVAFGLLVMVFSQYRESSRLAVAEGSAESAEEPLTRTSVEFSANRDDRVHGAYKTI